MEGIILLGAGGHSKAVIDVIENENKFKIIGLLDNEKKIGEKILGYDILGNDELIEYYINLKKKFVITVGHIKNSKIRRKLSDKIPLEFFPNIISPLSYVSKHSNLGFGNVIMHRSNINIDVNIGNFNIFNNFSNIEHEVTIGDFNHISTGTVVNGNCKILNDNLVGSNSTIIQNISIGNNNIIGAATLVNKNIGDNNVMVGIPAKPIK